MNYLNKWPLSAKSEMVIINVGIPPSEHPLEKKVKIEEEEVKMEEEVKVEEELKMEEELAPETSSPPPPPPPLSPPRRRPTNGALRWQFEKSKRMFKRACHRSRYPEMHAAPNLRDAKPIREVSALHAMEDEQENGNKANAAMKNFALRMARENAALKAQLAVAAAKVSTMSAIPNHNELLRENALLKKELHRSQLESQEDRARIVVLTRKLAQFEKHQEFIAPIRLLRPPRLLQQPQSSDNATVSTVCSTGGGISMEIINLRPLNLSPAHSGSDGSECNSAQDEKPHVAPATLQPLQQSKYADDKALGVKDNRPRLSAIESDCLQQLNSGVSLMRTGFPEEGADKLANAILTYGELKDNATGMNNGLWRMCKRRTRPDHFNLVLEKLAAAKQVRDSLLKQGLIVQKVMVDHDYLV